MALPLRHPNRSNHSLVDKRRKVIRRHPLAEREARLPIDRQNFEHSGPFPRNRKLISHNRDCIGH
ncbi:MAG: hypothetical protein WBF99_12195 [Xanthobacteraceae bacterium]